MSAFCWLTWSLIYLTNSCDQSGMLTNTWRSFCEVVIKCRGIQYVFKKCPLGISANVKFSVKQLKNNEDGNLWFTCLLFCLYSWSDVLGSYAVKKRDVIGKAGIFQRGTLMLSAWDHAWTSLNTWKMAGYFYGYLIFITKEWAQDFFPLLQITLRSTMISFKLTYAVLLTL